MGSITEKIPKPMLPIQGRPMLEHVLERLAAAGVEKFFVVVGYRHEIIKNHFRSSHPKIHFHVQDPVNGTGAAALLAKSFLRDRPFLLTYADILCESEEYVACSSILHLNPAAAAVVAVKAVDDPWQGAAVYEKAGRITRIIEKPARGASTTKWNNAGFYGFRPAIFPYLERLQPSIRGEFELTSALEMMLNDALELRICAVQGAWRDVGRPDDLTAVNLLS